MRFYAASRKLNRDREIRSRRHAHGPAPLDMVETFVTTGRRSCAETRIEVFRREESNESCAESPARRRIHFGPPGSARAKEFIDDAVKRHCSVLTRQCVSWALLRYVELEQALEPVLTRYAVEDLVRRLKDAGQLTWPNGADEKHQVDAIVSKLQPKYGKWLATSPSLEDVTHLSQTWQHNRGVRRHTKRGRRAGDETIGRSSLTSAVTEFFNSDHKTLASELLRSIEDKTHGTVA